MFLLAGQGQSPCGVVFFRKEKNRGSAPRCNNPGKEYTPGATDKEKMNHPFAQIGEIAFVYQ